MSRPRQDDIRRAPDREHERSRTVKPRGACRGFTLVEVLLALAITAVILTVVYMSFSSAGVSVDHAEAVRDETDLARTLIERIQTDLTNAYCRSGGKDQFFYGKKEEHEVDGNNVRLDRLSLSTLTNWRRPNSKESKLWDVGYFFKERPEGGGYVMMRSEKHITNDETTQEEPTEYEITDQVASLQLRYWDGSKFSDENDVGSTTTCAQPRPDAVEITLKMKDGSVFTTEILLPKLAVS